MRIAKNRAKRLLSALFCFISLCSLAQLPVFKGGMANYAEILENNIQFPPFSAETMECGYVLAALSCNEQGEVVNQSIYPFLNPVFGVIVQEALEEVKNFSTVKNKEGKNIPFVAVQPIGFLYSDKVCPTWNKFPEDSGAFANDTVFYLPEYNVYRDSRETADEVFRKKALTLIHNGNYAEAIPLLEQGMAFEPENSEYPYNLGVCYIHIRKPVEACNYLKNAKKMGNRIAKNLYKEKCDF